MNVWKLLLSSLKFYRKTHLWVVLGTMTSTSILVGALIIGDSVKYSLQQIVFDRLGNTEFALTSGDRFFRAQIADDISSILDTTAAPLLQTRGIAASAGGQRRVNNIQIFGADARFGKMFEAADFYNNIAADEAIINHPIASRLGLKKGDEFLLRIEKLDTIPKDVPLSLDTNTTRARRFKVRAVASNARTGRFNLKANQVTPLTIFISLPALSQEMGFANRANVLLIAGGQKFVPPDRPGQVDKAFKKTWTIADAGFESTELPGRKIVEIKSERIFLGEPIVKAVSSIDQNARPILTYFVNEISLGNRSTPYSFVSAPGSPIVPANMKDDEIIINEWLARDLNANKGDQIRLTYYVLGTKRDLIEVSENFRVAAIVPLKNPYLDRDLMPDFPGLAGEQNCRDWHPGIPIDLDKIRKKDEDYWDQYRGTPKAFVTLEAAQKMWQNRFGNLTAIRFHDRDKKEIANKLAAAMDPAHFGFVFREVKKEGLQASTQSVDFAQLFLGLSFFIIIAALLLTGLLTVFNVEKRSQENGLFLALGFPKKNIKRFVLMEGAVIILIGSLLGGSAAMLYNQIILIALKTVWHNVVGTSALQIHLKPLTMVIGTSLGIIIAFFTIWLVTRKQVVQTVTDLQRGLTKLAVHREKKPRVSMVIGIGGVIAVIIILAITKFETGREAFMFFFGAGLLLLISGISFMKVLLYKIGKKANMIKLNPFHIGIRNNVRRPVRSITLVGLLACGLFIVFTVGANRNIAARNAEKRESGTGGFALYGESSVPILYDLNSKKGSRFYGLDAISKAGVSYVQFRVKDGDDASCLNLNRVSNPRLIGVNPDELTRRGSFTFVKGTGDVDTEDPWAVLKKELSDGTIPAVADQTVILWGLGKSVGDTLTYMAENGQTFKIKLVGGLANSIFQGSLIISEKAFIQKYPSISGYRLLLIDRTAPPPYSPAESSLEKISQELSWAMQDLGLDLVRTAERLAEFGKVENTYLSIFLILGSFGLILGSIGLGIVVFRNVKERQGELALLRAVGFSRKSIQKMILSEHIVLLAAGIVCGIGAALLATLPSMMAPGSGIPYFTIVFLLIIVMFSGFIWTYSAAHRATRGNLLAALRDE